jgi:hypothetical protein
MYNYLILIINLIFGAILFFLFKDSGNLYHLKFGFILTHSRCIFILIMFLMVYNIKKGLLAALQWFETYL